MSNDPTKVFAGIKDRAISNVNLRKQKNRINISIGKGTCGIAAGALETQRAIEGTLAQEGIEASVFSTGCMGHCYAEPVVIIDHPDSGFPPVFYHQVTPGKARMIVKSFLIDGDPLFEHMMGAMVRNDMIPSIMDYPRFNSEERIVMEKCGYMDPGEIDEYIAMDGYSTFSKVIQEQQPDNIVREIIESGLRGRGGAGFPTGKKWEMVKTENSPEKTVICNADEGDPGAYMDRNILESNPHQLLEGIAICAFAVGAEKAVIYIRSEYPLAVETIKKAISQAEGYNLIGDNILGTGINIDVSVFEGSGAFVCGEETALIKSIEGKRGMPGYRPPYPAQEGLWGMPTVIDNVKTLSCVVPIVKNGASWFKEIGTDNTSGTAIFSIVGDVLHAGLVEIPMGVNLRELIFNVCGGIPAKKEFKAVQIGGPSGGCLPEKYLDTPIDFESLKEAGAMMGSGGMVVMDEDTCMVNIARFFLDFTQQESCGKCTFCRIGTFHVLQILDRITKGEGVEEDLKRLEQLCEDIKEGSLCNLGKTAPNPVITTLKYFRAEYEAHIREKRCPAGMCRALTAFYIDLEKCARGCDACVGSCPVEAIFTTKERKKGIDQSLCVKCGECMTACPDEYHAVVKISPPELAPVIERPEE
ncbi:MAG: NADH-ubiquinone oxidoreductase-F iron-sulfur binding region domain-containing protein [Desulfobacteraceae bacterium]|jgi:NADH-quinone oxidoreductase subunit F